MNSCENCKFRQWCDEERECALQNAPPEMR